jgi:hypothetical protein
MSLKVPFDHESHGETIDAFMQVYFRKIDLHNMD